MQILSLEGEPRATAWNGFLRADYATWEVGQDCPVHYHDGAVELFVFLDGECEMTVGDEVQNVRAGQAVYVGPSVPNKLKAIGDRPLKMFLVVSPNHEPTHTMVEADGTTRDHNRPPPGPEVQWLGKGDGGPTARTAS
jgi:mannose-6-phosphate isomerase-like protein (cupin superfamily)